MIIIIKIKKRSELKKSLYLNKTTTSMTSSMTIHSKVYHANRFIIQIIESNEIIDIPGNKITEENNLNI